MNVFHLRFSLVASVKVSWELLMQTCWWPLSDHWSVQSTSPHLSGFVFYGCLESLTELSALWMWTQSTIAYMSPGPKELINPVMLMIKKNSKFTHQFFMASHAHKYFIFSWFFLISCHVTALFVSKACYWHSSTPEEVVTKATFLKKNDCQFENFVMVTTYSATSD